MVKDLNFFTYFFTYRTDKFNTKKKIIHLLSIEWPLKAKQVFIRLKRYYDVKTSYQAVFKLLKELEKENVLLCKNLEYMLNIEWLKNTKKVLESVENNYKKRKHLVVAKNYDAPLKFEFDSFTDLCLSIVELLSSKQLSNGSTDNSFVCVLEYGWWSFNFKFEHIDILRKMVLENPGAKNIIRKKTKFGKWIREQYNKIGGVSAPLGTNFDINEDIFIQGNFIVEVKFSDESRAFIESCYNEWSNVEDAFRDLSLAEEPKIKATVTISKNPELARLLRKQIEAVFISKKV